MANWSIKIFKTLYQVDWRKKIPKINITLLREICEAYIKNKIEWEKKTKCIYKIFWIYQRKTKRCQNNGINIKREKIII